eukprot:scpid9578/ scgid32762/ 
MSKDVPSIDSVVGDANKSTLNAEVGGSSGGGSGTTGIRGSIRVTLGILTKLGCELFACVVLKDYAGRWADNGDENTTTASSEGAGNGTDCRNMCECRTVNI